MKFELIVMFIYKYVLKMGQCQTLDECNDIKHGFNISDINNYELMTYMKINSVKTQHTSNNKYIIVFSLHGYKENFIFDGLLMNDFCVGDYVNLLVCGHHIYQIYHTSKDKLYVKK